MCGRYSLRHLPKHLREYYQINGRLPDFAPRYNIAPGQYAPVIGQNPKTGERSMVEMRWGLVPPGSANDKQGYKTINARAETIAELKSFRNSFRRKRCIIPASGFYEWRREGKERQPFYFQLAGDKPMGFAGLWASWKHGEETLHSFTIITTAANKVVGELHERMPVIVPAHNFDGWLDLTQPEAALQDRLAPYSGAMTLHPVSKEVNKVTNQGEGLIKQTEINSL